MSDEDEILSLFSPANGTLEPDVLSELQSIMRLHDISAEDLFFKWESYCIQLELDAQVVALQTVRSLKQALQDKLEKSHRQTAVKSERKVTATPRVRGKNSDVLGLLDGLVPGTPRTGPKTMRRVERTPKTPKTPATGVSEQLKQLGMGTATGKAPAFAERANAGEVVEILNEQLPAAQPPKAPYAETRIKLTAALDQKIMAYKTTAMKISEMSDILDDRIEDFADVVREHHGLDDSAFGNAATAGTTEIVAVGRIASDSLEGKLNAASLVLETSKRSGRGLRVPLNMGAIKSWSFFPGQIVALRGINTTGNEFRAKEILETPSLPSAASPPASLEAHRERLRGGPDAMDSDGDPPPLNILYAAGPYTPDDNLDFEPLHALCSEAADTYADALVLTGPFLDIDHPLIATGDFDLPEECSADPDSVTMSTVFRYLVAPALNRLVAASPHIAVILVPSVRDVLDKHVSWPQDTMARRELGLPKSVRIVTNPMTLSMNEAVLGVSSQDVLFELLSDEVSHGAAAAADLMGRLCRYIIQQRHYYPIFPPTSRARLPKTGTEEGVATGSVLDLGYLKLAEMVKTRPDIMLIPSFLPPFAKVVESVLVINPGSLSKRRGPGTYARMTLQAPSLEGGTGDVISHRVFDRARVEIVKI
ncbi:DNA polymerase alpha subunit B [Escovopsis weberi]|uniref:DNA polymerase alpha subunit B n=1 Tax=Escovopsis weberi TaxID=150374 RepID=A0A0M9VTM6_ESCWE|nr:DNA polymerase alpha subunit B [Escovopsis weberi]